MKIVINYISVYIIKIRLMEWDWLPGYTDKVHNLKQIMILNMKI